MDVSSKFLPLSPDIMDMYSEKLGVFVSLYNKDQLRACLGRMDSDLPLYKTLSANGKYSCKK